MIFADTFQQTNAFLAPELDNLMFAEKTHCLIQRGAIFAVTPPPPPRLEQKAKQRLLYANTVT